MRRQIIIIMLLLAATDASGLLDDDHDGYCEDTECATDRCPGTPQGSIVDTNGCSCMQKTIASCAGNWCCPANPDPCIDDCAEIDFAAVCTNGTKINYCGQYRDCPDDGCFATQIALNFDFPEDGHDYCEAGQCIEHSCEPLAIMPGSCDFSYCQKTYGMEYWCASNDEWLLECKGRGTVMGSESCARNSASLGVCVTCETTCIDDDQGSINQRGTVNFNSNQMYDTCIDSNQLVEWFCGQYGSAESMVVQCMEFGMICNNGACEIPPIGNHKEMCGPGDACVPGIDCLTTIAGIKRCCLPGECPTYEGCIQEDETASILGREYMCKKGALVDSEAAENLWCEITTDCQNTPVIRMSETEDSHASTQSAQYANILCCKSANHALTTSSGNTIMRLSDPQEDAHVSLVQSQFPNTIMLGADTGFVQCTVSNRCATDETCVLSIYGSLDDAHVGGCDNELEKLCCRYTETNDDTTAPIAQAEYDGNGIIVLTNEQARCYVQSTKTEIPCTDSGCTEHYLAGKIAGAELISCKDSTGNIMKRPGRVSACQDGTPYSQCSTDKPKYCNNGKLEDRCDLCGCIAGLRCGTDGLCESMNCLEKPNTITYGDGPSGNLINYYEPAVTQAAQDAVTEYAGYINKQRSSIDTANEYMEAVAYYVDKNMEWMADEELPVRPLPFMPTASYAQDAITTIRDSGTRGCGKKYCGDCEDHAILRLALLRKLGVNETCAYAADHIKGDGGHSYNIVNYRNSYRIMDYEQLGEYFTKRLDQHITHNIWNDWMGAFFCDQCPNQAPIFAYNYPNSMTKCPASAWTYETYYTDVCP